MTKDSIFYRKIQTVIEIELIDVDHLLLFQFHTIHMRYRKLIPQ